MRDRGAIGWIALVAALVVGIVWIASIHRAPPVAAPVASRSAEPPPAPAEPAPSASVSETAPFPRTPASASGSGSTFDVRVVDPGKRAIAGARIQVRDGADTLRFTSDASGRCTISTKEPPGEFVWMTAEADGFCPSSPAFKFEPAIEIVLAKALTLKGRVLDETTRSPIVGAKVRRSSGYPNAASESTPVTGADGSFELPRVPAGGRLPIDVIAHGGPADSKVVTIAEQDEAPAYDFLLARGTEIRGRVLDWTSGEPVTDAVILDANRKEEVASVEADGRFAVRLLPQTAPDSPVIGIRAPGHSFLSRRVRAERDQASDLGDVRLPRSVALEGTVRDASGVPIAGMDLLASVDFQALFQLDAATQQALETATKGLGEWRLEDLQDVDGGRVRTDAEGKFRVESLTEWMQRYWVRTFPNERRVIELHGEGHEAAGGTIRIDVVAQAPSGTRLAGRLLLNGKAVAGTVRWKGGGRGNFVFVGEDGRFVVDPIPEGHVTLDTERGVSTWSSYTSKKYELDVKPGESIERDFDVQASVASTSGRILTTHGAAMPGVHLAFQSGKTNFEASVRTAADGRWSIDLPLDGEDGYVRMILPDGERRERVRPGATDVEWRLPAFVRVHVRGVDKSTRNPVPKPIVAWRKAGDERFLSPSEGDGSILLPTTDGWYDFRVPEGTIDVRVAAREAGYPATSVLGVAVSPEGSEPRIEVELERGWTVTLRLAEDQPAPPGRSLWCFLVTPEERQAAGRRAIERQVMPPETEENGRPIEPQLIPEDFDSAIPPFHIVEGKPTSLTGVRPGRYRLLSTGPFHVESPDTIDLAADGTEIVVRWKR
jgi:hypothetical protein